MLKVNIMNLNNEFATLKEEIDAVVNKKSIEEKKKINNLNKLRSNMSELITLISNSLSAKHDLYQDLLKLTCNIDLDHKDVKKADWCFTLKDYNYSVKLKLETNDKNDIRLNLYQIPKPNFIFYILNQDGNWKFAKVKYGNTRLEVYSNYTNINNAGYDYSFSQIKESNIVWLSDLSELTDCILSEVICDIKENVKRK